jgi:hypothetical protein
MTDRDIQQTKRCSSCGASYLLDFYRRRQKANGSRLLMSESDLYRDRCIGCETSRKRSELMHRRLRRKAVEARRRHGAKFKELGKIKNEDDLEETFGWSIDRMIEDIKRIIIDGCPYCWQPVDIVERGLRVITIDIVNTDHGPHYSTNIRWCCEKCNSEKQNLSPAVWGARRSMWELWYRNQKRSENDPEAFGFFASLKKEDPNLTLWD